MAPRDQRSEVSVWTRLEAVPGTLSSETDPRAKAAPRTSESAHRSLVEDEVTQTVPVKREEIRVEREPITDANIDDAMTVP